MVVFASGAGSTLEMLLKATAERRFKHEIVLLVTDSPTAGALKVAEPFQIPVLCLPLKNFSSYDDWDRSLLAALLEARADFAFLAGFLKKIGPAVLNKFHGRIFNTHPSLLPRHGGPGMFGRRVHESVLKSGDHETGASIHLVNEHYDQGQVLKQVRVPVMPEDTVETLEARVKDIEKVAILEFLNGLTVQFFDKI